MAPKLSFATTRGHTLAAELCMEWGTLNPDDRLIADLSPGKEDFQLEGHRRNGGTRQLSISKLKGHRDIAIVKWGKCRSINLAWPAWRRGEKRKEKKEKTEVVRCSSYEIYWNDSTHPEWRKQIHCPGLLNSHISYVVASEVLCFVCQQKTQHPADNFLFFRWNWQFQV